MSNTLCTFSGRNGDILWSLATAKEISRRGGRRVDFAIMPQYKNLLPLLQSQAYINQAFVINAWQCTGSPHGDQPWEAPIPPDSDYDQIFHLTYRSHPGIGGLAMPLIDFIAYQQGLKLTEPVIPFVEAPGAMPSPMSERRVIPYAFNGMEGWLKQRFVSDCSSRMRDEANWVDISGEPWLYAADIIEKAGIFVGDRSACWVLAVGLGVPTITYEPNVSRAAYGQFGQVFGCPYAKESALHADVPSAVDTAVEEVHNVAPNAPTNLTGVAQ